MFWFFIFFSSPVWGFVFAEVIVWYFFGSFFTILSPKRYRANIFFYSKRGLDIAVSGTILLIIAPFFLGMMLCNWIVLGSPIFFVQQRIGRYQKKFCIIKFRSMCQKNPSGVLMKPEEVEISCYGAFIRSYSLDEVPSLWNVIRGDLSLVGPRPLVPEFINERVPLQRHSVRPGLTGLAQIKGRNFLSWSQKFSYDLEYIQHQSYTLDVKILLYTLRILCSGENSQLACEENFFP
ncbi:sugar transferase [Holospora elegans]|uniref:sugar transferase n=1 Tax=Holospora elegans TaxID=431043 RepID=UPI00139F2D16|nr:sugar transferase [Holospora elegans]